MYQYLEGFIDTEEIHFCCKCGKKIKTILSDGTAKCESCGFRFGAIAVPDEENEK